MRAAATALLLVLAGPAAAQAPPAPAKAPPREAQPAPAKGQAAPAPAKPAAARASPAPAAGRTATLAILDKRSGAVTDVTLKPGERFTVGRITGVLRSCDQTPPHERRETAAYVEIASVPRPGAIGAEARPRRLFAGWMFAESPSLNPFVHPGYDVWLRACTIPAPVTASQRAPTGPKAVQSASRASASARRER